MWFRLVWLASIGLMSCNSTDEGDSAVGAALVVDSRPNIVLVMTDDQGYGDLGMNHNPVVNTPNIDQLAQESINFTDFHVDPTCSPTRAALMTGKSSMKAGVWHTVMGRSLLASEHQTIAEILSESGYTTGIFGKWHLGDNYPFRPQDQGFDYSVIHGGGGVGQTGDYWGNNQFDDIYYRNGKPEYFDGFSTHIWLNETKQFIRDSVEREQPFFAYLSTNAPHTPWRAYQQDIQFYRDKGLPEDMSRFYAMVTDLDRGVGDLRQELASLGVSDNTIFIFMTDNGSSLKPRNVRGAGQSFETVVEKLKADVAFSGWRFNAGMRDFKGSVYEGGHRVPFIIHYPNGDFGEAREIDTPSAHFDVLPTLLEFAGIDLAPELDIDGVSLASLITNDTPLDDRKIIVTNQRVDSPRLGRPMVVIDGKWRYVSELDNQLEELFDLSVDPDQSDNVIEQFPEKAAELRAALQEWWKDVSNDIGPRLSPIVGAKQENPARLNANDWMEAKNTGEIAWHPGFKTLFLDENKTGWLGRQDKYKSLPWHVEVAESGEYEISIYFHDKPAQLPVNRQQAFLELNGTQHKKILNSGDAGAQFKVTLDKGPLRLRGWFEDKDTAEESHIPAFYAYIELI